jgi:hypothetical protein
MQFKIQAEKGGKAQLKHIKKQEAEQIEKEIKMRSQSDSTCLIWPEKEKNSRISAQSPDLRCSTPAPSFLKRKLQLTSELLCSVPEVPEADL